VQRLPRPGAYIDGTLDLDNPPLVFAQSDGELSPDAAEEFARALLNTAAEARGV
jgi:hypothetical protein